MLHALMNSAVGYLVGVGAEVRIAGQDSMVGMLRIPDKEMALSEKVDVGERLRCEEDVYTYIVLAAACFDE